MKSDFIKDYWESQASKFKSSHEASWGDGHMIDLEIEVIQKYINSGNYVLDMGCANGYSSFRQFTENENIKIDGMDFSANMIDEANITKSSQNLGEGINFQVGDIRKIDASDEMYDVTYTTRVLINLPNWEEQKQGIDECLRVTKKGGTVVLSEAFWEPLNKLNAIRAIEGLEPLVEHDFNRYLKKSKLESFLKEQNLNYKVEAFSSLYYLGTRFLRETLDEKDQLQGFGTPINEIFYKLEQQYSGGSFGIQQAYIITK